MMLYFAYSVIGLALILFGMQLYWAWRLAKCYPASEKPLPTMGKPPRVAVVLAVRGADPSLVDCVRKLLIQDYHDYEIFIVIDSIHDPAWKLLKPIIDQVTSHEIRLQLLEIKHTTCSLKVSALSQAISRLDSRVDVVAFIDADVTPHTSWLSDLLRPFSDIHVGATTGVRWYLPARSNWGSMVRCLWNAAACTQMFAFEIPWGGSLAVRAELFRTSDLLDHWLHSFCEDTVSYRVLHNLGYRVAFVHSATMINPERIALGDCFAFIRRQMLTVRLHHPAWPFICSYGVASGAILALLFVVLTLGFSLGELVSAELALGAIVLYSSCLSLAMIWIQRGLTQTAQQRGERIPGISWLLPLACPLAQILYLAALVSVSFLRKVDWRGITYELNGATPVRLIEYRPYSVNLLQTDKTVSVL